MANPQKEEGFTPIANEIAEALMRINISAYESRVLWFLFRKTYGWGKKTDWISLSQFANCIGLDRRLIHRAIKGLSSKKMIVIERDDCMRIRYGFQKNYHKWVLSSKEMTVINTDDKVSSKEMMKLSSKEIPTKETNTKETIQKKEYFEDFLKFWKLYPLKVEKPYAHKCWQKSSLPPLETILIAIQKQIEWRKNNNGEFRPPWKNPATWLNRGCWDDELNSTGGSNGTKQFSTYKNNFRQEPALSSNTEAILAEANRRWEEQNAANGNT